MVTQTKTHSQSGFMSVESIANSLFYLIMISIVTLIASTVMNSGKVATTVSALSILRSNLQYVGSNVGHYGEVNVLSLPDLVPGLLKHIDVTAPAPGPAVLPSGEQITVASSAANDPNDDGAAIAATTARFRMLVEGVNPSTCRKLAYYGLGGGYGVMVNGVVIDKTVAAPTPVKNIEDNCGMTAPVDVVLTSR